jgi:hypothetical protein
MASIHASGPQGELELITVAKIEANRQNALKSTGPRTPAGRARSALNHASHWLCSKSILVPGEDLDELHHLQEELADRLEPVGVVELLLADRIVSAVWRLRRACRAEAELIGLGIQEGIAAQAQERLTQVAIETQRKVAAVFAKFLPEDDQRSLEDVRREEASASETLSVLSNGISQSFRIEERGNALERVGHYERLIESQLYRALHELERLQAKRSSELSIPPLAVDASIETGSSSSPELMADVVRATDHHVVAGEDLRPVLHGLVGGDDRAVCRISGLREKPVFLARFERCIDLAVHALATENREELALLDELCR